MSEKRWLRCGAEVVTPDGIQTVSTYEVNDTLVWTEDDCGNTSVWSSSQLRPPTPVSYREHACVVAERDRLRRELEALRDEMRSHYDVLKPRRAHKIAHNTSCEWADRLDAILSGGES